MSTLTARLPIVVKPSDRIGTALLPVCLLCRHASAVHEISGVVPGERSKVSRMRCTKCPDGHCAQGAPPGMLLAADAEAAA